MANNYDEQIREIQWGIDMIKDHALNFLTRLNLAITESVYMNMLNCPPSLTMLNCIIAGNADIVLTPSITTNNTFETLVSKGEELRSLKSEVVEIIRRLLNVMDQAALYDLLSGKGEIFIQRERVYYWDVYNQVTMEEELHFLRDEVQPSNFMVNSSDDDDDEPIHK